MASYVKSFHPRLVGLTGTAEQVAQIARAYRVYYAKVKDPKLSTEYTIDHSAIIYLMSPEGNFVTHFPHSLSPDLLARRLKDVL